MKIISLGIVVFLLFVIQRLVYEKLWDKNLVVTVKFAQSGIAQGEKGQVIEIIENRKRLPLTMVKVKFQTNRNLEFGDGLGSKISDLYYRNDLFQIGSREKITRTLPFVGAKRGFYHIKNIDMVGTDLFLAREFNKSMSTSCYIYVYPKVFQSMEFQKSLQKLNGDVVVRRHLIEDPFEYRGIREYQPYDDLRSINWKATAKSRELMVNQKNYTAMQTIRIFLNLDDSGILRKYDEIEVAMQIVMGLANFFLAQGIKVSFSSNGKDVVSGELIKIDGGAGIGQQEVIGKALARIDIDKTPEPFVGLYEEAVLGADEGCITLFVSPNKYEDYIELLQKCCDHKIDFTWFYPYDSTEQPSVPVFLEKHTVTLRIPR